MKRFNTDRIRQRMREHNERFPRSKGKLISSPPLRISVPPQTDKENAVPVTENAKKLDGLNNSFEDDIGSQRIPHLSIAVTMSEAEDEEDEEEIFATSMEQNESNRISDDEDNHTVPSVWAMMEHYQGFSNDTSSDEHLLSKRAAAIVENDSYELTYNHSLAMSLGSNTTPTGMHIEKLIDSGEESNSISEKCDASGASDAFETPSRIHWLEGEDGELIQRSFYTQGEASETGNSVELETSKSGTTGLFTVNEEDKSAIFRSDAASCISDQAVSPSNAWRSARSQGEPSPTMVQHESVDSGENEDYSSYPDSLFQGSTIQSMHTSPDIESYEETDDPSNLSNQQNDGDSETQASVASHAAESKGVSELEGNVEAATDEKTKQNIQTQEENDTYVDRLGELESTLKFQQQNTDEVQSRLKERVLELEQALKVTVATPRGTTVDENPLKTLLNRNQTLVKEVRFADQTCVELSSKISELELRNEKLRTQVAELEQGKSCLKSGSDEKGNIESENNSENETRIEKLEKELALANENLRTKAIEEESLRITLRQAIDDLSLNDDVPGLSFASSIMSERDSLHQDYSIDSRSVHSPRSLQQQIGVLVEKAKKCLRTQETDKEILELRSENFALNSKLNQIHSGNKSILGDTPKEDSNENLKIQKENEFLGRQLGIVQEKLDQAQKKLEDEYQKSRSMKMHLERGVEMYKRLIEPLERRLTEYSKFNSKLENVADADKRLLSLEKEFVHVKASISAMKLESERLLNVSNFDVSMIADLDQQSQIVSMFQTAISRMAQSYKQLEVEVDKMVEGLSDRLDGLTSTISLLRSSLIFEQESVSTADRNTEGELEEDRDNKRNGEGQNSGSSFDLIDATIPVQVEETRTPRKHEISISSDLDDISRLLNDDMTLESIVKTGSVFSSTSMFKESLEAAVNECKRVRERSIKLKDQIESQQSTIKELEQENGKLSLNICRRNEEFALLESALEEAKEEIKASKNIIASNLREKEDLEQELTDKERKCEVTKEEIERLTKSIAEIEKKKEAVDLRNDDYETSLAKTRKELESITHSNDENRKKLTDLQSDLSTKIRNITEQKELESAETRRSLKVALHEKAELKRFYEETLKKLTHEVESKMKLETLVNELKHSKLQAQSDLEDKDLESQFACEDMRKERAELKYKLSQSEKELSTLKESYKKFKAKTQRQIEEKSLSIEETETQKSGLLSKVHLMTEKRISFVDSLETFGCCTDLTVAMGSKDSNSGKLSPFEAMVKEIDCWTSVIPLIGDKINALSQTKRTVPKLELEIEKLRNDLSKHEIRESDQTKQADDQTTQNEKLIDLLRQAEEEMERSTHQIKEMSEAMAVMQRREDEATNTIGMMESELMSFKNESETSELEMKQEINKMKTLLIDTSATLEKKESQMLEMNSQMNKMRSEIEEVSSILRCKESEGTSLKANLQSCENKNSRLREYIRKLTTKCEEWEISYDRQSRAIDRLEEKKTRMKEKACDIAGRYRALVADVNRRKKMYQHDRQKWSHERSNLNSVHAALEQELEQIAKELGN